MGQARNKIIQTEIDIDAPSEIVWDVLSDFTHYSTWNPIIKNIIGECKLNARLQLEIEIPNQGAMNIRSKINRLIEGQELSWQVRMLFPGILTTNNRYIIHKTQDNTVKFEQIEKFSGLISGSFIKKNERNITLMHKVIIRALKHHCESRVDDQ